MIAWGLQSEEVLDGLGHRHVVPPRQQHLAGEESTIQLA
jgi:hypothetical protein